MAAEKPNTELLLQETKDAGLNLSVERTELALERTQLAWIRTTLSFLASGIALDKGMEIIHKARVEAGNALFENAHAMGIALSLGGTFCMLLRSWFCFKRLRNLALMKGAKPPALPPVLISSLLVTLLGIVISVLLLVT